MRIKTHLALLAISSGALLAASPSFALDQGDFLSKLNGAFKLNNIELKPGNISVDGNNIRFEATKIISPDMGEINVGDIAFSNVKEEKGGYLVERVDTEAFEFQAKPEAKLLKAQSAQLNNYYLPAVSDFRTFDNTSYAETGFFNGLDVAPNYYPVFSSLQRFWAAVFWAIAAFCGAEPFRLRSTASRRGLMV